MTKVHTIPLHIGDLLTDTMHLSPAELGGYVRLLAVHYRVGSEGLPEDDAQLRRITGMDNKTWKLSRPTILAFFTLSGDRRWVHGKVQKVLLGIRSVQEQNTAKALKRWKRDDAAALPEQCRGSATAVQSRSHKPKASSSGAKAPSHTQRPRKPPDYTSEFEGFWLTYPRRDGSKSEAFKAYQQAITEGTDHGRISEGARQFAGHVERTGVGQRYVAHATTWLNQRRWEAEYRPDRPDADHTQRTGGWAEAGRSLVEKYRHQALAGRDDPAGEDPDRRLRRAEAVREDAG